MRDRGTPIDPMVAGDLEAGPGNVLFDVWLVSRSVQAVIDEAIGPVGLDADEFAVYSVLAANDGMTPTALARWMAAPPTTVSSYVKRFQRRGHVERVTNPEDGRSYMVQLTAAGRQAHADAGDRFAPVLAEVEERLGTEVDEIHRRLRELHLAVASGKEN